LLPFLYCNFSSYCQHLLCECLGVRNRLFFVVVEVSARRLGKWRVIDSFLNFPFLVCFCEQFSFALRCCTFICLGKFILLGSFVGRKRGDIPSMHCSGTLFKLQAFSAHFLLCCWGHFLKAGERFPCSFQADGFIVKT